MAKQRPAASTPAVSLRLAEKHRLLDGNVHNLAAVDIGLDTDPTLAANSDERFPSQKAVRTFVEKLWPVGSVYVSTSSTNPGTLFGFGTWVAAGAGQTLVGQLAGDPDFGTVGQTGGVKTVSIADHAHHTHDFVPGASVTTGDVQSGTGTTVVTGVSGSAGTTGSENPTLTHKDATTGLSALKTLPPYVVVIFWHRTA